MVQPTAMRVVRPKRSALKRELSAGKKVARTGFLRTLPARLPEAAEEKIRCANMTPLARVETPHRLLELAHEYCRCSERGVSGALAGGAGRGSGGVASGGKRTCARG